MEEANNFESDRRCCTSWYSIPFSRHSSIFFPPSPIRIVTVSLSDLARTCYAMSIMEFLLSIEKVDLAKSFLQWVEEEGGEEWWHTGDSNFELQGSRG